MEIDTISVSNTSLIVIPILLMNRAVYGITGYRHFRGDRAI